MTSGLGVFRGLFRRDWRLGIMIELAIVVVVVAAIGASVLTHRAGTVRPAASLTKVQRGTVTVTVSAAGVVQAVQTRGLSFSTSGTVTEVNVKPGDTVTVGQVLARIDPTDAASAVTSAQSNLDSANESLTRAQATTSAAPPPACQTTSVSAFHLGASTSSGSASAPPSGQPTRSVSPSGASLPQAPPSQPASPTPSSSPSQPASPAPSQSASPPPSASPSDPPPRSAVAFASPSPSVRPGASAGAGGSQTGGTSCSVGGGSNGGTGNGGGRSGGSDSLYSAEAQVHNAALALRQAEATAAGVTITAPAAGKVLSVGGAVGSQESPGGTGFIVLGGLNDIQVRAQFSEADVAQLAVGQTATIELSGHAGQQITGTVSQLDPAGTASGRLVRYGVYIAFSQVPSDFLFGQGATVTVVTSSASGVLYVLSSAVVTNGSRGTLTVRMADGPAVRDERRDVEIGLRGDQYTEIRSGLVEGTVVVVSGPR